jgi:hypothetical protein
MIIMQIRDNEDGTRSIVQHIEKVLVVEYRGTNEWLYLTEDNPLDIQSLDYIEGCRITIK